MANSLSRSHRCAGELDSQSRIYLHRLLNDLQSVTVFIYMESTMTDDEDVKIALQRVAEFVQGVAAERRGSIYS